MYITFHDFLAIVANSEEEANNNKALVTVGSFMLDLCTVEPHTWGLITSYVVLIFKKPVLQIPTFQFSI